MATGTLVSLKEYLSTSYRPDCDYIDGEVLERNLGEHDHAWLQLAIGSWLWVRAKDLKIRPLTECRLQVKATRFRIPDILVLPDNAQGGPIIRNGPILCIEILSKDDTMKAIMARIHDYLEMGVPTCWILDPVDRLAWVADAVSLREAKDGVLHAGYIALHLSEIFAD